MTLLYFFRYMDLLKRGRLENCVCLLHLQQFPRKMTTSCFQGGKVTGPRLTVSIYTFFTQIKTLIFTWPKMKIFRQICFFSLVIPKFPPFLSCSYRFWDKTFLRPKRRISTFSESHDQNQHFFKVTWPKIKIFCQICFFPWWSQNFLSNTLSNPWS